MNELILFFFSFFFLSFCWRVLLIVVEQTHRSHLEGHVLEDNRRQYLLDEINAQLQIHAKVNEGPFDALALIFLLFQDKHMMIEELLQFFVSEIDAQLFETVVLYTGNGTIHEHTWMMIRWWGLWSGIVRRLNGPTKRIEGVFNLLYRQIWLINSPCFLFPFPISTIEWVRSIHLVTLNTLIYIDIYLYTNKQTNK